MFIPVLTQDPNKNEDIYSEDSIQKAIDEYNAHRKTFRNMEGPERHEYLINHKEEVDPRDITRQDIMKIAWNDVILHRCIDLFRNGYITWEQAIMYAVLWLSVEYSKKMSELIKYKEKTL